MTDAALLTVDPALIADLKTLDTTTLTDAMDRLRLPPRGLHGLKPVLPGKIVCGLAFTVRFTSNDAITDPAGDFLDDVPAGAVIGIDNRGRTDNTVWGDIMAWAAKVKGVEATFIDGVCRDIPGIREADYPMFTKGVYMVTGKGRTKVEAVMEPIVISDLRIHPGDILFGDDSGAICIPRDRVEEVVAVSKEIAATEAQILARVKQGLSLREARAALGYHSLQTPRD